MLTQLNMPIPLQTPKGKAWAVAIIDYGPQWDLQWVTFVHATGECWTFRNDQIRQEDNYTFGIPKPSPIKSEAPLPNLTSDISTMNGSPINGNGQKPYSGSAPKQ